MTMLLRTKKMMAAALLCGVFGLLALPAQAQTLQAPGSTSAALSVPPSAADAAPAAPLSAAPLVPVLPPAQTLPMPAQGMPGAPVVFGSQMFSGRFAALNFTGFNSEYQIAVGDRLLVRMWGAVTYEAPQIVDAQGNIFLPNIGPIQVLGVRNQELNRQVEEQVRRTFRSSVGVYATLDSAQPVKIYVTGFVRAPGLYGGLSSDSVLSYLDKAGGIDPDRGSYLSVKVLRAGKLRATMNLYRFLLDGQLDRLQFQDGDTVVVQPRTHVVTVAGEAQNTYVFELDRAQVPVSELVELARPKPNATHLSIVRNTGVQLTSEYYPLGSTAQVTVHSGDLVTFTADKYTTTLLVRITGSQLGERAIVLPTGATLKDLLARLNPSPQANLEGLQLFRRSVQARQRASLDVALRNLETAALTARSSTVEEANLRKVESDMMLSFITRARAVQPLGQVVLSNREQADKLLLEDGDTFNIPEHSNLVLLSGEVLFPNAQLYNPDFAVEDYVGLAGGYTQSADTSKQVVLRPDGRVASSGDKPNPGDEILVLPKIDSKNLEITRAISQVLYQIAVAAKVALGL
jgi:protein involved in polysaccharide export with SLBB domain